MKGRHSCTIFRAVGRMRQTEALAKVNKEENLTMDNPSVILFFLAMALLGRAGFFLVRRVKKKVFFDILVSLFFYFPLDS